MKNPAASLGNTGVPCRISVTYRPIQELKPDPTNPRRHKQEAWPPSAPAGAAAGWKSTRPCRYDLRRWQALTGGSARHAASGRSFDDLAREAGGGQCRLIGSATTRWATANRPATLVSQKAGPAIPAAGRPAPRT